MKRRAFLYGVGSALGTGAFTNAAEVISAASAGDMPRRALGKTGRTLPVVGFPGLALSHCDEKTGVDAVHRSMDIGVNYFDVAPAYGKDGECEIIMGKALQDIPRDKYFLACKTQGDDAAGSKLELERSLQRLKTDHFDLYQLHCLQREDEVKQALGPGGVLETILKAKEEGKIRHIGFSAHTTEAALAALKGFDFDTCMFPINFVEYYKTGFGREVLALAEEKGTSIISIKPVSRGLWPKGVKKTYNWWYRPLEDTVEYQLAMDWVLAKNNVVSTLPSSFLDVFQYTVAAARAHREPTAGESEKLKELAATCVPIFKPVAEKKAAAQYQFPGIPAYPSRRMRV